MRYAATPLPPSLLPLLAVMLCTATARADVVVTATAPPSAVVPGAEATVDVYFLNTGPAAAAVDVPATLPGRVTAGGRSSEVTLRHAGADAAPATSIAPGAFVRAAYVLAVPATATGPAVVAIDRPGSRPAAVVVAVAPPVGGPAGAPDPVTAAGVTAPPPPASAPSVAHDDAIAPVDDRGDSGIAQWITGRFSGHEPIYFLVGPDQPNAKFQVSFKYQVLNPDGSLVKAIPPLGGLHVAYSQTSFWDLEGDSKPFFDNSYRPEVLWSANDLRFDVTPRFVSRLGLQVGLQHESNGRGGDDSRSLNVAYVQPSFTFGDARGDGLFLTVAPKVYGYVGSREDNATIADYRGHVDLRAVAGWQDGLQLSTTARLGDGADRGSLQFDLTYPLRELSGRNVDLFLHAQYFNGFGESLLTYDESTSAFRLGVSLVR